MGFFDNLKKNATLSQFSNNPSCWNPTVLIAVTVAETVAEKKAKYDDSLRAEGFEAGYRKGISDTAKKFANILEQNDKMRIGMFAVGYHVAKLGEKSDLKCGIIVDELGNPNSSAVSDYVRGENGKIISVNLTFDEICNNYLDSLSIEQLNSIDSFLVDIINAGGSSAQELNFYNNDWKEYLTRCSN
ncbi:MAG: hypothetical protein IJK81_04370 [Selenomonadaceae bacterium]|nr:hypothetical protein [Selenomonadaceae bacterium]